MFARHCLAFTVGIFLISVGGLAAQVPPPMPTPNIETPPPAPDIVAARVNGKAIAELAVYRGLMRVPPQQRQNARKDVLNYLIDNKIVDQYLLQLNVQVDGKVVEEHIKKIKDEAIKEKLDFKDLLKKLLIEEDELRAELTNSLRWDRFVVQQGTDKVLQPFFVANIDMFNGRRVRARHILIPITDGKKDEALAKITAIKKNIEAEVELNMTKVPPKADNLTREKERAKALEKAFAEAAVKESSCPSKRDGGDLEFFARVRDMVEPFARVAFALKQYQMSDPVITEFGYHLILQIDSKPGKDVKFEEVKPNVQEVYGERLREAVLARYRSEAKIEIVQGKR